MQKNDNFFIKNYSDFDKYSLELWALANNLDDNKRQIPKHIICNRSCEDLYKEYMPFMAPRLLEENTLFDNMGDDDLINYEKWLK